MRSALSRGRPSLALALVLVPVLALAACPSQSSDEPLEYVGDPGVAVPVTFYSDVPQVDVALEGAPPLSFLLDTGAPATILDTSAQGLEPGVYEVASLDLLGITVLRHDCAALALFGGSLSVGGIVGGDILRHFALVLDYRDATATLLVDLDGATPPGGEDLSQAVDAPFQLLGGGLLSTPSGDSLQVRATRVVVPLEVEGHEVLAVVDTGASTVVLDEPLYELLSEERPDRPVLEGLGVLTVESEQPVVLTRLARLSLGGAGSEGPAERASVVAMAVLGSDSLAQISLETGRQIDALLGASFLRYYRLTVDYPARKLTLQAYPDPSHVQVHEYVSVGFSWEQTPGGVLVDRVLPSFDAEAQGLLSGDRILTAGPFDIQAAGAGGVAAAVESTALGDRVRFTMERGDATAVYEILVEDLLPDFQ